MVVASPKKWFSEIGLILG